MTDYSATFPCGCPAVRRRIVCQDTEVHQPECPERARQRAYGQALHRRYDHINTVIIPTVEIVVEDNPTEEEPDVSALEFERPAAIPNWDMSLTMARVFQAGDPPSPFDWAKICTWWLRRQAGLLGPDDQG